MTEPAADDALATSERWGVAEGLLTGKVIAVAGVGPGLGAHIAVAAARAGAAVVLGARSAGYLDALAGGMTKAGFRVAWERCDISDPQDCARLVARAVEDFGGLDGVVQNAYRPGPLNAPILDADFDEWRAAMDVNLFGSLQLSRAAVPAMRARGGGSLVFVSSQIVRRVLPGRGAYAASKAALMAAAQVLARELGPERIRVNCVVPGRMWGPSFRDAYAQRAADQGVTLEEVLAPVRALLSLPDIPTDADCVGPALFLLSDLASAMTGQGVDVNGGETFH